MGELHGPLLFLKGTMVLIHDSTAKKNPCIFPDWLFQCAHLHFMLFSIPSNWDYDNDPEFMICFTR